MSFKRAFYYLFLLAIFGFFIVNIFGNLNSITHFSWRINRPDLAVLILVSLFVYIANSFSWHLVTKSLNLQISYLKNIKIWMLSNAGRLIPGVIWQYVGRVYFASKIGVSKVKITHALLLETTFSLIAGSLMVLIFSDLSVFGLPKELFWLKWPMFGALVIILMLLHNTKFFSVTTYLFSKLTHKNIVDNRTVLEYRWIVYLLLSYSIQFMVDGAVLFFLTRLVIDLPLSQYFNFVSIFAVSWMLGYAAIFAPGGIGVQELSIAGLLSFYLPLEMSSLLAIVFRLVLFLSELFMLSVVLILNSRLLTSYWHKIYNSRR